MEGNSVPRRALRRAATSISLAVSLMYRHATASLRVLPNVFILGAANSGSTSLAHMLWQHPAHVSPFAEELTYLQQLPGFESTWEYSRVLGLLSGRYKDGHAQYVIGGYRKFFPTRGALAERRKQVGDAFTSDCDPFNLYCDAAMQRIMDLNVSPRFIVCLRHPVARAYAAFYAHRASGLEDRTFSQAIKDEIDGVPTPFRKRYLEQSIYVKRVERWFEAFPRDRFLILRTEDLFSNAVSVADQMFSFIGLPRTAIDASARVDRYTPGLDTHSAKRLLEFFRPHNERLSAVLGRDMQWR
jgi:hypothetical protein